MAVPEESHLQSPDVLERWLESIDAVGLHEAMGQLSRWSTLNPAEHRARGGAAWALTAAPALEELYRQSYPDALYQHERLRLLEVDIATMNIHHRLITALFSGDQLKAKDIYTELAPLLRGTTQSEELPDHLPLEHLAASPAGQRRISTGMSSEMRVMAAQVRFRATPPDSEVPDFSILDWREAVVSTLNLSPSELSAARTVGIYIDAQTRTD